MASNWRTVRLGDLVTVKHGWPFKSDRYSHDLTGRPIVVSIGNFDYSGGFRFDSTVAKEYRGDYPAEYNLIAGDILLVMTCQTAGGEILGLPGRIPNDGRKYLHNQRLGKVVVKSRDVNDRFLYWLFLWSEFNRELVNSASGTKIVHTAPARIEAFEFRLPPLHEQAAIAASLDALDHKIELNRKMSATLEAMARALFKSWFVDFDPVRVKAEGRDPGLPPDIAVLFPDSFEDSELGPIPHGWALKQIADIAFVSREAVNPLDFPEEIFEHYSIPAFDSTGGAILERGISIRSNKFLVSHRAVLLSRLNPRTPRIVIPLAQGHHRAICSTEFAVMIARAYSREWLYCLFSNEQFCDKFATMVTGTSGSHQRVKSESLLAMHTVAPSEPIVAAFTDMSASMLGRIASARSESVTLSKIRDALLPKLISGEIRVADAERVLEKSA
ncbi:MAG TPA: restriction endonuclease subunit S [Candidatus Acidoferrales bacterium]|nr:restriction endonuclease subunit S [Candidatus Acidoferrales bacterium]